MKTLFNTIYEEMINAAKNKDTARVLILRTLISEIKGICRKDVNRDDVMNALIKGVKQREDSLSQYTAAGRTDLAEQEAYQISVLKEFLPQQMSEEAVRALVVATVDNLFAGMEKNKKLMGAVMKELGPQLKGAVMEELGPQLKGKADMKFVNKLLSELLS